MNGRLAYDLEEISRDPRSLDQPGFWAVSTTFEGDWTCARFGKVIQAPLPPPFVQWIQLDGGWTSSLSKTQYEKSVSDIREQIAQGWVYQVNACREMTIEVPNQIALLSLMHKVLKENPAPFASYLRLPGMEVVSASPELLLRREKDRVTSGPIKGTKHLGTPPFGGKDTAENIMIVDLIRNDLGKICKPGSVSVPRLLATEDHPGLSHLVSDISGDLIEDIGWNEIGEAILPPGSVSGAPKSAALKTIRQFEPTARGPYCGALGWVEGSRALLSVAIRIFWTKHDGQLHFGTGAGITWGSDPIKEWIETQLKASRLLSLAGGSVE